MTKSKTADITRDIWQKNIDKIESSHIFL